MKKLGVVSYFFLTVALRAAIVPATSPSLADVRLALLSCNNGDTLTVPAGDVHWIDQLVVDKAIILKGNGIGSTIIRNDVDGKSLVVYNGVANSLFTITGFSWLNGSSGSAGPINAGGVFRFLGFSGVTELANVKFRFHHNYCDGLQQFPIFTDTMSGVVDHNVFRNSHGIGYTYNRYINGVTNGWGDGSWATPTRYATEVGVVYYEDNDCEIAFNEGWDGTRGGNVCVRFNTITMLATDTQPPFGCHGLEGRNRSIRYSEFYCNYIVRQNTKSMTHNRGGPIIEFSNRVALCTAGAPAAMHFQFDRGGDSNDGWGRASGSNPWDVNSLAGTVISFAGHTFSGLNDDPKPFDVGSITTTATDKIIDDSKAWPKDKWVGYSATDIDQDDPFLGAASGSGEHQYQGGVIVKNDSTSLTLGGYVFHHGRVFSAGQKYKILKVEDALDCTGRAGNDANALIVGGGSDANPPTPTTHNASKQVAEPAFEWNNYYVPGNVKMVYNGDVIIRAGVHYKDAVATIANKCPIDYPWDAAASVRCGADIAANVPITGSGGAPYPHSLVGATPTPTPTPTPSNLLIQFFP